MNASRRPGKRIRPAHFVQPVQKNRRLARRQPRHERLSQTHALRPFELERAGERRLEQKLRQIVPRVGEVGSLHGLEFEKDRQPLARRERLPREITEQRRLAAPRRTRDDGPRPPAQQLVGPYSALDLLARLAGAAHHLALDLAAREGVPLPPHLRTHQPQPFAVRGRSPVLFDDAEFDKNLFERPRLLFAKQTNRTDPRGQTVEIRFHQLVRAATRRVLFVCARLGRDGLYDSSRRAERIFIANQIVELVARQLFKLSFGLVRPPQPFLRIVLLELNYLKLLS